MNLDLLVHPRPIHTLEPMLDAGLMWYYIQQQPFVADDAAPQPLAYAARRFESFAASYAASTAIIHADRGGRS